MLRPPVAPPLGVNRLAGPVPETTKPPRATLPLLIRLLAWVLAVPVGLLIVGLPARMGGYLTSQQLLDVIVKRDLGRFVPLVVVVVLWALATALLVELICEGGRWWLARHSKRRLVSVGRGPLGRGEQGPGEWGPRNPGPRNPGPGSFGPENLGPENERAVRNGAVPPPRRRRDGVSSPR